MIKSPFCGAYKIIILGHNHLCLTPALSANMRKQRIGTVRLKLLKIAAKVIRSARYITFKLCSSCPYKDEFYKTLSNISKLCIHLE